MQSLAPHVLVVMSWSSRGFAEDLHKMQMVL